MVAASASPSVELDGDGDGREEEEETEDGGWRLGETRAVKRLVLGNIKVVGRQLSNEDEAGETDTSGGRGVAKAGDDRGAMMGVGGGCSFLSVVALC